VQFLTGDELYEQLRRCLNDEGLPLLARIVGVLIRLYGLHTTRVATLITDRFHEDDTGAYFTFDRIPVLLPPKLAALIKQQIESPYRASSVLGEPLGNGPRYLFPGRPASQPLNAGYLQLLMKRHGLPNINARNTAMIELVGELPPIVISDLFGLAPATAHRWAEFAQNGWADYLAACQEIGRR
jgi:hypothetical protein